MAKISYNISIGSWSVNSAEDPRTELAELETQMSLNSPNDSCRISVYAPPAPQPSLLEQAIGAATSALGFGGSGGEKEKAFSVQIRGNDIKQGDPVTIELTAGEKSVQVMAAEVQQIQSSLGQTEIVGVTGLQKLAQARLNQGYENQSLSQIVQDIAGQVGVSTGEIETGNTYPYLAIHDGKSLLTHIVELAKREGLDVYCDPDNQLTVKKFTKTSADHTFYYGIDLLDLHLFNHPPTSDQVQVSGESPSSNQGTETWHWLVKDPTSCQGKAGKGSKSLSLQDGAIRTKDTADSFAKAKVNALKNQATGGQLKILGNPTVKLGDAIEIKEAPKPELNGLFKVASVRHIFNKRDGYLTVIGFIGQGDAEEKSGDLLGQLAGALGL
jgi:hypothetical protein